MKTQRKLFASALCFLTVVLLVVGLSACGRKDCTHEWGDWVVKTNATCTEAGVQERTCSICGEVEASEADALGHDWAQATCSAPKTCLRCSATEGTAAAHSFTVETVKPEAMKSAATCMNAATYYKSCACGAISTSEADAFSSGDALAHSDSNSDADHICDYGCGAVLEACSDVAGDGNHACDVCGNSDVTACSYGNATCGAPASCVECGAMSGQPLSHRDENRDHICDGGCGKNDMGDHSDSASDSDHVCDYGCGVVLELCSDSETDSDHSCDVCSKANVTVHNHVESSSTPATCEAAETKTFRCNCGDHYDETVGAALGHDISGVTPTERQVLGCQYILVYVCKNTGCGEEVVGETIDKHTYVATITTPATCQTSGEKTFRCSACGDNSKAPEVIAADATYHQWVQGSVVDGVRTDTCSVSGCGATKTVTVYTGTTTDEINAGDLADTSVEVNNANISLDSGVIDTIGGDQSITISADKLEGNDRQSLGLTQDQLDNQVGSSPIYNFTIQNGSEPIANFGENNYVTVTLPYNLDPGEDVDSIAIWFICDACADESCQTEDCQDVAHRLVSMKATYSNGYVTFKTNHFSYYTVTRLTPAERCALYGHGWVTQHVDGSCTQDSYDLSVCVRCHEKMIENLVVADGHDYAAEVQDPTCTEKGTTTYTCKDCSYGYTKKVNAHGHEWLPLDASEPTCTSDGFTKYSCVKCEDVYTAVVPKIPHPYEVTVVDATCTSDGYTHLYCPFCGYSGYESIVPALGHDYKVSAWTWAADYSSASLTMVCAHDSTHVTGYLATVSTVEETGSCSSFIKKTYTATVIRDGVTFTDQKVVEIGTPEHKYGTEWLKSTDTHWHECACGAKSDEGAHIYQNGVCSVCGIELAGEMIDAYYVNLVRSWKNIDGFSVTLKDLTFNMKQKSDSLTDALRLMGSVQQMSVAELSISAKDGKLAGAASGSFKVFGSSMLGSEKIYTFKAVIQDEFVYMSIDYGTTGTEQNSSIKMSVETLKELISEEMFYGASVVDIMPSLTDSMISILDTMLVKNADKADEILEDVFNMIFTLKTEADGTVVATLDYAKLYALNENLATKSLAEVVDLYFGEGFFAELKAEALEILNLKMSEIPKYLEDHGMDSDELIDTVGTICDYFMAIPKEEIKALLESADYADLTIGMLVFGSEDDSYADMVALMIDGIGTQVPYDLIDMGSAGSLKETVDSLLDMIKEKVVFSFTTDASGMLTKISLGANELSFAPTDYYEISLGFTMDIVVNGSIKVTWNDIVNKVNDKVVAPEAEEMDDEQYINYDSGWKGDVNYKGDYYTYHNAIGIHVYQSLYDRLSLMMINPDCDGWARYYTFYGCGGYLFEIATIQVDGEDVTILIDRNTGKIVELVNNGDSITAIFEDGTQKTVSVALDEDFGRYYLNLYLAIFDNPEYKMYWLEDSYQYYYHAASKQYADESQHDIVTESELVNAESCEHGVTIISSCTKCDLYEEYTYYGHVMLDEETVDLTQHGACGGEVVKYACPCGQEQYVSVYNHSYDQYSEHSYYDNGRLISVSVQGCSKCGLRYERSYYKVHDSNTCTDTYYYTVVISIGNTLIYSDEYTSVDADAHDFEIHATLKGGEDSDCSDGVEITRVCRDCGEAGESTEVWGHYTYEKEIVDLSKYGSDCGGTVTLWGCACGDQLDFEIDDALCDFGREDVDVWVSGALSEEGQYGIDGWNYFYRYAYIDTCAVTNPEACAFKIRYARYWVHDAATCTATEYEIWQIGYDEATGTCAYELKYPTGDTRTYHSYINNSTKNYIRYDCSKCGSYYYEQATYKANGDWVKTERGAFNTKDGTRWTYLEEAYNDSFGDYGYRYKTVRTNDSKGSLYEYEYAYTVYQGSYFEIYNCTNYDGIWYRYDYSYSFVGGCQKTTVYTTSSPYDSGWSKTEEICSGEKHVTLKNPTCTQDGESCYECQFCGKRDDYYTQTAYDHRWEQLGDGWYYCERCGLENLNGASGSIVMEDLCWQYGNDGEYYVVGYYVRNMVSFTQYVSLILPNGEEIIVDPSAVEFVTIDGVRAVAFRRAEVVAWATENGYSDYQVKFTFVPVGADSSFDYALTFTEPDDFEHISESVSVIEYVGQGEEKVYYITPAEDGDWLFTSPLIATSKATLYRETEDGWSYVDNSSWGYWLYASLEEGETYKLCVSWVYEESEGKMLMLFHHMGSLLSVG